MTYKINIAKREQIRMRYGKMEDTYRHYFRIKTDMFGDDLYQLVSEQKEMYPWPEYKVSLYTESLRIQELELDEVKQ